MFTDTEQIIITPSNIVTNDSTFHNDTPRKQLATKAAPKKQLATMAAPRKQLTTMATPRKQLATVAAPRKQLATMARKAGMTLRPRKQLATKVQTAISGEDPTKKRFIENVSQIPQKKRKASKENSQ